jgi:hypothetical protein
MHPVGAVKPAPQKACPSDTKVCANGQKVNRTGPLCTFNCPQWVASPQMIVCQDGFKTNVPINYLWSTDPCASHYTTEVICPDGFKTFAPIPFKGSGPSTPAYNQACLGHTKKIVPPITDPNRRFITCPDGYQTSFSITQNPLIDPCEGHRPPPSTKKILVPR